MDEEDVLTIEEQDLLKIEEEQMLQSPGDNTTQLKDEEQCTNVRKHENKMTNGLMACYMLLVEW